MLYVVRPFRPTSLVPWLLVAHLVLHGEARAAADTAPPQIVHEPCDRYQTGRELGIWARFYDDSALFQPKLVYRTGDGGGRWQKAPFVLDPSTGDFKAVVPARELRGKLEYFIELFDEHGNGPARFGGPDATIAMQPTDEAVTCQNIVTPAQSLRRTRPTASTPPPPPKEKDTREVREPKRPAPLLQPASAPPPAALSPPDPEPAGSTCERADPPLYCSGWLWVGVGAVAVAAGATTVWLLSRDDGASRQVFLDITAPSPADAALGRRP